MPTLLSTKKLSTSQKQLLLNSGLGLVEYDAIKIEFIDFTPEDPTFENAIVTSKNSAKAILKYNLEIEKCFCVGLQTANSLRENGYHIAEIADYGADLAQKIAKNHQNENFTFFCGNKRRDELPAILTENNIRFSEIEVYRTTLNLKVFQQEFDGLLFFSPSAVKSYTAKNKMKDSIAFCIGKTTTSEAEKYTSKIITATKPSIENVVVQAVKYFKTSS